MIWVKVRWPPFEIRLAERRRYRESREGGSPKVVLLMNRNVLYLIIAALVVVAAVVGFQLYQERQKTDRIEIKVDKGGISIEKK